MENKHINQSLIVEFMKSASREAEEEGYLIVKNTIISGLFDLVPEDKLRAYWSNQLLHIHVKNPAFGRLVKEVRKEANLSQGEFASKLTTPNLKLYQSDIGNLERGQKLENYREKRLENIRVAILKFKAERTKS